MANIFPNAGWCDVPEVAETLERFIRERYCPTTLSQNVFARPHWIAHPRGVELLLVLIGELTAEAIRAWMGSCANRLSAGVLK